MEKLFEAQMMVQKIDIKTLRSGDKSARITLETLFPEDAGRITTLGDKVDAFVVIWEKK